MLMNKKKYIFIYSVIFTILFILCIGQWFCKYEKAYFRFYDGLDQHYLSFLYVGRWIREITGNIFINHNFSIPMWDMAIGYGGDILTTFSAYLGDPFNWISALIPEQYAEYVYAGVIIGKMYISGLAYSMYAFYHKKDAWSVLAGAIIYVFSGTMFIAFVQPFFINPMYLFPVLLLGVDKIFENESPKLFIFFLFLNFVNYFYFAYMSCVFVFLYCCVKYVFQDKSNRTFKSLICLLKKFVFCSVVAVGLSAAILFPIVMTIVKTDRLQLHHYLPLLYDKNYYSGLLAGFISSFWMGGKDCIIGFGAIALLCVIYLFVQKRRNRAIKIIFAVLSIGLCVPYFGHAMNGFNYAANRWVWAYCLCVAYIVTITLPELRDISYSNFFIIMGMVVIYALIIEVFMHAGSHEITVTILFLMMCFAVIGIILKREVWKFQTGCLIIVSISVVISSYFYFCDRYKNSLNNQVASGQAYNMVTMRGALPLLEGVTAEDGSRYDRHGVNYIRNASWLYGMSGMDFYVSIYNNDVDRFNSNIALLTSPWMYGYSGLDRRTELEALFGVNYYLVHKDLKVDLPYGYSKLLREKEIGGQIYQMYGMNEPNALMYTFDKAIDYDSYMALTPYERQQVLLQACVVPQSVSNTTLDKLKIFDDSVEYTMEVSEGVHWEGNKIYVDQPNSHVQLKTKKLQDSEIYVYLEFLDYSNGLKENYSVSLQGVLEGTNIYGMSGYIDGRTDKSHMYGGKHNWLVNLGYTEEPIDEIIITFNHVGDYILDSIKVYERKQSIIEESIQQLDGVCEDIHVEGNRISANASFDSKKYLFISVPYSKGWKAYINGKEAEIIKTNDAFMAILLEAGEYKIELRYITPYVVSGIGVSITSLVAVITYYVVRRRKNKIAL